MAPPDPDLPIELVESEGIVKMTQAERIARMEAILERIEKAVDAVEQAQRSDVADLAALKNKGSGILIGVAIAAGAIGATASSFLKWLVNAIV